MSDLEHLQERLRHASNPDEYFGITISQRFIRDGLGGHVGKMDDIYLMRYRFQTLHEIGTGQCVAYGGSVKQAMERFEVWLAANPNRGEPERQGDV